MKNSLLIVGIVAMLAMSCSDTKETPTGYKYTVIRKGDGNVGKDGQILVLNLIFKDSKDSIWSDSRNSDMPMMIQKSDSLAGGNMLMEVLQVLSKGDSVSFNIPASQLFPSTFQMPVPPGVEPSSLFTFHIGVTDLIDEEGARQLQTEALEKMNEKTLSDKNKQLAIDTVLIDNYLKEHSMVANKTSSGLRYIIKKQGKGENAVPGQSVKVNYAGFLLDGRCFDTSIESVARENNVYNESRAPYEPIQFVIGYREVIPGWEEALTLMNKGSKMTVYIPSGLAYGPNRRSDVIAENSILMFDMELVDIK
jgi:FKBP-type peptidyl-prolyl cis-trans isomerase